MDKNQSGLDERYARELGFMHKKELEVTKNKVVAIAGLGGDGHVYPDIVRGLPLKEIRLADPETIDKDNYIKHAYANNETYGRLKVDVIADDLSKMAPETEVKKYPDGITLDNVEDFVAGSDVVVDELELRMPELAVSLHRAAKKFGKPVLTTMNIGFGAVVSSFHPEGHSYEQVLGIPKGMPLDEVAEYDVPIHRMIPVVPWKYVHFDTFRQVAKGAPFPSNKEGIEIAAAMGKVELRKHLVAEAGSRRIAPIWAPKWHYMDAYTKESRIVRPSLPVFYSGIALMALRSKIGLNPEVSYSDEDLAELTPYQI